MFTQPTPLPLCTTCRYLCAYHIPSKQFYCHNLGCLAYLYPAEYFCNVCHITYYQLLARGQVLSCSCQTLPQVNVQQQPPLPSPFQSLSAACYKEARATAEDVTKPCSICARKGLPNVSYQTANGLADHIYETHTLKSNGTYYCPLCPAPYVNRYDLKNHIYKHTGATLFQCEICHRSFAEESLLKAHSEICNSTNQEHIREYTARHEQFKCEHCRETFGEKRQLAIHTGMTHPQEEATIKSKYCPFCIDAAGRLTGYTKEKLVEHIIWGHSLPTQNEQIFCPWPGCETKIDTGDPSKSAPEYKRHIESHIQ